MKHLSKSPVPVMTTLLALGAALGLPRAEATGTPAGTTLTNVATATFDALAPGGATSAQSNLVSTTVQAVCAVSITPNGTVAAPGQTATLLPGERAVFPYTVVNAGNTSAALAVAGRVEGGGAFTPTLTVVRDLNGNGVPDPGEPSVSQVSLPADGSARLLLLADTNAAARGDAFVNLTGSCGGASVTGDADNVSRVTSGEPPELAVDKSFTPALVRPGTETTVNVTATNGGQGDSREVVLTDRLADQLARGLSFVPGSAGVGGAPGAVLEYTADGATWEGAEPAEVRGVRVRVPSLPSGARLTLSFRMLAGTVAENQVIPNVAVLASGGQETSDTATADVRYQPAVAIGPLGQPEAPEGSDADTQIKPFAVVGQPVCFDHTLKNTGDVRDRYRVAVSYGQGAAQATLLGPDGAPLAQPLVLDPGGTALVRVCYDAAQAGSLNALVTSTGERGTTNATRDLVQGVEGGLPELRKTASVAAGVTVAEGEFVTYTLSVRNPYSRPLTNVVVTDPLPAHTDFVEASAGGTVAGDPGAQTVTWNLGTLQPGETRTQTVKTVVSARAVDGEELRNVYQLRSAELPTPLPSNEVVTPVWSASLLVVKEVSARAATYGDRLVYTLRIRNQSATTAIVNAVVTDSPAVGLAYIPGTSTLGGGAFADPSVVNRELRWTLDTIPAGGEVVLTYATRVTPEATGNLLNTVQVVGTGAGGSVRSVASNRAQVTAVLQPLKFAPLGDLVGVVFVDRDRNGVYDARVDTPVERARVILAGGRLVLTDSGGRYHFFNVSYGTQALRLDPNSTPYPPLARPTDGGLGGTQTVQVRGLTSVDFPLAPLPAEVNALRRTVLTVGDVRVEKVVRSEEGGYAVTLRVTSPRVIEGFVLTDPLPAGATLKEGRNTFSTTLSAGETTLTYRFVGVGQDRAATTDPAVSWRY